MTNIHRLSVRTKFQELLFVSDLTAGIDVNKLAPHVVCKVTIFTTCICIVNSVLIPSQTMCMLEV